MRHILEHVRTQAPLIHNITNYVTANDCANILLACGASPIMADDAEEVEDITRICDGLNINIGTLNHHSVKSMFLAGHLANELRHPVLLDPVGAGASFLRTRTALELMDHIHFSVIRGNMSEIKALSAGVGMIANNFDTGVGTAKGVDANPFDAVTESTLDSSVTFAKSFAKKHNTVVAITGAIDIVADADQAYIIRNGVPMMARITGSGCMLSAMTAAYIAANPPRILQAAAAAVSAMGICGELALERMSVMDGNASYRAYLIDAVSHIDGAILEERTLYEIR